MKSPATCRLIKRHYIANPLTYVYLFYDLMYYPEVTEFYLNINGSDITGFVLIWHAAWGPRRGCSSVHIYGSVDGVEGLIPTDECLGWRCIWWLAVRLRVL